MNPFFILPEKTSILKKYGFLFLLTSISVAFYFLFGFEVTVLALLNVIAWNVGK